MGHFVWKADGLAVNDLSGAFDPIFKVEKVRVQLGKQSYPFMQIFTYREVADLGTLDPSKDLLVGKLSRDIGEGQTVALSRERWQLRPGQIVNVDLSHQQFAKGFFAPAQSIIRQADRQQIYVVKESAESGQQAQLIEVRTGKNSGTLIEIMPVQTDELREGMKLIVDGAQYVQNGDPVNAFQSAEVKL